MALEFVTIVVGGFQYSTWESVDIDAGAKAARGFTFVAAEPDSAITTDWPLAPNNPCQVFAGGDLLVTGYIDEYAPDLDVDSHKATITGRSKGADAVDCAALHDTGYFENKDIGQIAQALDKFGIGYTVKTQVSPVPVHQLVPGQTLHQELDILARAAGVLMVGNPDGSVNIITASEYGRHAGALVEGVNFKKASAKLSAKHKHSEVHVKGQKRRGHQPTDLRIHKISYDPSVPRYRPRLIIHEGDTDDQRAQMRADWHVARQCGLEVTADVTVRGWRDEGGAIWDPQKIIYLESPRLKIDQDMAIQNVKFHQGDDGTYATLSLVDPQALGGKDAKGNSNKAWNTK